MRLDQRAGKILETNPHRWETVCYHDLIKNRSDFLYDETYPTDHLLDGYMDKANLKEIRNIRISTISNKLSISSERILTVTHEECHCHYAYWGSRFRTEVLCMTAEGIGDYSNGTVSKFSRSGREELSSNKKSHRTYLSVHNTSAR